MGRDAEPQMRQADRGARQCRDRADRRMRESTSTTMLPFSSFCEENSISFIIVGPEAPLAGVADRLARSRAFWSSAPEGRRPPRSSKTFTKEICDACAGPTAAYARFTDPAAAKAHIDATRRPHRGQGRRPCRWQGRDRGDDEDEAHAAIDDMFGGAFGEAGAEVVIEEFMTGEEASVLRALRRQVTAAHRHGAGSQAHRRGRHRPQHGRHGRLFPGPGPDREVADKAMTGS
jgi:phosphoribosylamine--glycine ligase